MRIKIIDKCCNEYKEMIIDKEAMAHVIYHGQPIQIAPAKKGHSITVHPDNTIEYLPIDDPQCRSVSIA